MSDCPNEITNAASAIVKRLYPDTLSGSERNGVIRRIEAQIMHYIEPLRGHDRAATLREAGNFAACHAATGGTLATVYKKLWQLGDEEEAKAKEGVR